MASQSLKDRCLQAAQDLSHEKEWQLPPEGIEALVEAILPFARHASGSDDWMIRKIALNYYLDGPTVQQMRTQESADGGRLWEEWRNHFVIVARRKGVSPEDADDLVHDVYVQANKALHTFRFESRLKTFFYSIFGNCYKQWLRDEIERRRKREISIEEGKSTNGESLKLLLPDKSPLPEDAASRQIQSAEIRLIEKEIRKILKSEDFQILHWYYVEETYIDEETGEKKKWTDKAIGERLAMPRNTVTSRRRRALQRILEYVRDHPRLGEIIRESLGLDAEDADA